MSIFRWWKKLNANILADVLVREVKWKREDKGIIQNRTIANGRGLGRCSQAGIIIRRHIEGHDIP